MKKTISLSMKFWHDGQENSTRVRNVKYCWNELKKLNNYINTTSSKLISSCYLFDFSTEKIISDAIHIPYPIGEYKKAEKTNLILNNYTHDFNFFMMIDSDAFFDINDYSEFISIIDSMEPGDIITFDLAKIDSIENFFDSQGNFDRNNVFWNYAYSGKKDNGPLNGYCGGLGGVYIIDTSILLYLNGFNEKYIGWGGEDGEMLDRIMCSNIKYNIRPQRKIAPFHLPHFCDFSNPKYNNRF